MNMFSCKEVKEVVRLLMGEQKVKDKIYVAGGIAPWILSGNDSGRKHGDIDIVVEKDDMVYIASEECAMRVIEPNLDNIWSPRGGEPVIVRLDKQAMKEIGGEE